NRPAELARRNVDEHLRQRPPAEPVLTVGCFPARQRQFAAVPAAHARAFHLDLAAVKSDLAFRLAPAVSGLAPVPAVARAAQLPGVLFHHAGQRRQAGVQTEALEAGSNFPPSPLDVSRRDNSRRCDTFLHGVAFLRGFDTPSLRLKVSNAYLPIFNRDRDIPQPRGRTSSRLDRLPRIGFASGNRAPAR